MDIMNNMTVSTSKLTFSLIAVATLLIAGSAFTTQEAFGAISFTAYHNTTTQTTITFNEVVNGTLDIGDWKITVDGLTDSPNYAISDILNTTYSTTVGATAGNSNFINNTQIIHLIHAAIPSDAEYNVNYTDDAEAGAAGNIRTEDGSAAAVFALVGIDATADDRMIPTFVKAEILRTNPSQVKIEMSETVVNLNSTIAGFSMTTLGGGNAAVPATLSAGNNTSFILVNLQNPAKVGDILTIAYNTLESGTAGFNWITDGINSDGYLDNLGADGGAVAGHGNRMGNLTATAITNWLEIGMYGDVTTCYDCAAPIITDVKVSLDSSIPIKVTNDNQVHINAGIDDTVSVMVTVADNLGADTIPFAGIYTNFGETPDNLYYSNNFDSAKQMSTSYYEWNVRNDDVAFDNNGAITWTDATAKVNADRTQTFTYTMTINDAIESSQVWVDIGDKAGNYAKLALPITLEVSGAPGLTFASDDTQKVVSFFNESILLAIVSQWTATSSDDASNVEQLSSVLGIETQLPTWTTELASWVADDKIDVADMIVAVEYVINL